MTTIPSKLKIVGREYDVVKDETCVDEDGSINFETNTIYIKNGQQRLSEVDTLLHESLHAIDDIFQLDLTERQVFCAISGIIALFRDNPALMLYINDALNSPRKVV